jgi:predicted nucleotidyltransferase
MTFGLEQRHWETIERLVISLLKAQGAQVWIFGSRARGDNKPFSDLDILYKLRNGSLAPQLRARMAEDLEQSTLPIKVDVVAEEDLAQSYIQQILADRIQV